MLAIVIPYYKITFFKETLDSLANQTDKRFKVYIGDDASPENPENLLKQYEGKFDFVYKRFDENLGGISLTKQWERCIEMMEDEEWLMILGDDDRLGNNVIEEFFEHLVNFEYNNVVRYSSQVINEDSEVIESFVIQPRFENAIDSYNRKLKGKNRSSLSEYVFRVSKYEKFGFKSYPLGWTADDRAVIDFADKDDIYSINDAIIDVRMSDKNISSWNPHSDIKQRTQLRNIKELIFECRNKMTKKQLQDFIQHYECYVFSFKHVEYRNYLLLFYLFICYMSFRDNFYIVKATISKII